MNKIKRIGSLMIIMLLLNQPIWADNVPDVLEDKAEEIEVKSELEDEYENIRVLTDLNVYDKEGYKMVPLRKIGEELGFEIIWNSELKQVQITKGSFNSSLKANLNIYFLNEGSPGKLCLPPEIKDGVMYVPIDFFEKVVEEPMFLVKNNLLLINEKQKKNSEKVEVGTIQGYIKDVLVKEKKLYGKTVVERALFISVGKSDLDISDIVVHIMDETDIYDLEGNEMDSDKLKVGNEVEIVFPSLMTMSVPPQTTALTIVNNENLEIIKSKNGDIYFPEVNRLGDDFYSNSIKNRYNEIIEQFISGVEELELYEDATLNYFITNLDDDILSIVFRGDYTLLKEKKEISKTLNIDRNKILKIDTDNYFKDDKESVDKLKKMIRRSEKQQYGTDYNNEKLSMYFTEDYVVFYYFEEGEDVPIEVYILRTEIEELIV